MHTTRVALLTNTANGMLLQGESFLPVRPAYTDTPPPTTFPNVRLTSKLTTTPPTYSTNII